MGEGRGRKERGVKKREKKRKKKQRQKYYISEPVKFLISIVLHKQYDSLERSHRSSIDRTRDGDARYTYLHRALCITLTTCFFFFFLVSLYIAFAFVARAIIIFHLKDDCRE